jgi:hypothetical protein
MLKMMVTSPVRLGVAAVSVMVNVTAVTEFAAPEPGVPVMVPSLFSAKVPGNVGDALLLEIA